VPSSSKNREARLVKGQSNGQTAPHHAAMWGFCISSLFWHANSQQQEARLVITGFTDSTGPKPMGEEERRVPPISAWYIDDQSPSQIIQTTLAHRQRLMAAITSGQTGPPFGPLPAVLPAITLKALIVPGGRTLEGVLIEAIAAPWFEILDHFHRHPESIYEIDSRTWEEIIAGAWKREGYEVELTPRSGDKGRDVVATQRGWRGTSIRIFDQVKAYAPGNPVTADEVRSMLGVITGAGNVSKGVITTTSRFAPRIMDDEGLARNIPFRLELKDRDVLLAWLNDISTRK
jgi:restriction system protein